MKIGVLAVQGDFAEHEKALASIGVESVEVRLPQHVLGLSGLILPGGESTAMRHLIARWGLREPILELAATHGLNPAAIGHTRLRVGEGIVGLCAASGQVMNLPDAQNHPAFAYRAETGEEPFASMLAVPVRRAGRTPGGLTVQNRAVRR